MIITIDGYAGSGKTTLARQLAETLGFELLNTGGMYRAAAIALTRLGIDLFADPRDEAAFTMPPGRVILNGTDYTSEIRTEEAGRGASRVATFPEVRERLKQEQRRLAANRNMVCEGRDQGTAVFPDAPVKFFLTASAEVRADRRVEQLRSQNLPADRSAVLQHILARDDQDENRPIDPLKAAPDAIRIDTTTLGPDAVLNAMLEVLARCRAQG
jgi:cytidylate kinase